MAVKGLRLERATRLEVDGRGVRASGALRGRVGSCAFEANALEIAGPPGARRLVAEQACLASGGARLTAHRLSLEAGGGLSGRWLSAEVCRCGRWSLGLRAAEAWSTPGGRRLHLRWPVFRLGAVPLLAAPYWALALRPATSGLLWPRVGYSGRDGLRLEQGVYLAAEGAADLELVGGWHQTRGPLLRGRLRWRDGPLSAGELSLLAIADGDLARLSAAGAAVVARGGLRLALHPDLVSDGALLRHTAQRASRVFAPFVRSRLIASAASGPLVALLVGDLYQDLAAAQRQRLLVGATPTGLAGRRGALHGAAEARTLLSPVTLAGPLLLLGEARWTVRSAAQPLAGLAPGLSRAGGLALVDLAPGLALGWSAGPLRLSGAARYLLQLAWLEGLGRSARHGLQASAELALPLARRLVRWRHVVEPFLGWRAAVGQGRWTPAGTWLVARDGGLALAGVRSRLARASDGRAVARAAVALAAGDGLRLAAGELALGRRWRLELAGALSLEEPGDLFDIDGRGCVAGNLGQVCGGYLRQRLGLTNRLSLAGDRFAAGWALPSARFIAPAADPRLLAIWTAGAVDQAYVEVSARLGPLAGEVQVYLDPVAGELTHGRYRVTLGLGSCDCYGLSLQGHSRRGQRWPDLMLGLRVRPRPPACLGK